MAQTWNDVLFAHWPFPVDAIRPLIPAALGLDTFDGRAWVGVVPFWMTGVRPRLTPSLPRVSTFPELNVRTYVVAEGKPGVYFFSLDAGNWLAVEAARRWFRLPYYHARMSVRLSDGVVRYTSERSDRRAPPARFVGDYRPTGPVFVPEPGSLDRWLVERYALYTPPVQGRIHRGEILHAPWPIQPAETDLRENTMVSWLDLTLPAVPPVLHYAKRLDVVVWWLEGLGQVSTQAVVKGGRTNLLDTPPCNREPPTDRAGGG
jgi:uncharacterized protein YqjF (DUF2071 family)